MKLKFVFLTFLVISLLGCAVNPKYLPQDLNPPQNVINTQEMQKETPNRLSRISKRIEEPAENNAVTVVPETERKPMIALTFDDGPSVFTRRIVDILDKHGAAATFFVLGENIDLWKDTIIYAFDNGNEISSHTWSHMQLPNLTDKEIEDSIVNTYNMIEKVTGAAGFPYYRPPYGLVNHRVAKLSADLGFYMVGWTIDPEEWKHHDRKLIYDHIMEKAAENSIVLLHDIFAVMPSVVERLIPALIAKGYRLVTISELLHHVYGELKPGLFYGNPGIVRQ